MRQNDDAHKQRAQPQSTGGNLKTVIALVALVIALMASLTFNYIQGDLAMPDHDAAASTVQLELTHWITIPDAVIAGFERDNPAVSVHYRQLHPGVYAEQLDKLLADGQPPDLLGVPNDRLALWQSSGYLLDLSQSTLVKQYDAAAREAIRQDAGQTECAVALSRTYYGLWYRTDLFERCNIAPPRSFAAFLEACRVLYANQITPLLVGEANNPPLCVQFYGGTLPFLQEEGYLYSPNQVRTSQEAMTLFLRGEAAMLLAESPDTRFLPAQTATIELVGLPGVDGSQPYRAADNLLAIAKDSDKTDACLKFLSYLSKKDVAAQLALVNGWHCALTDCADVQTAYHAQWKQIASDSAPLQTGT